MDGARRPPKRVFLLRVVAALVAVAAAAALVADLAGKAQPPTASPTTSPSRPVETEPPKAREPARPRPLAASAPTIYDSLDDLDDCARTDRALGPASRRPGPADDIRTISRRLERIRRLEFATPVDARLLPREEVGERFVGGEYSGFAAGGPAIRDRVLVAFGLVPEGFDVLGESEQYARGAVSGFYDTSKERLFSGATADALEPFDEVVLAHELDHALVDQTLGLPSMAARRPLRDDRALAHQALVEGDATLAMSRYASARLTPDAAAAFLARFSGNPVAPPVGTPFAVWRPKEFPYFEGVLLACSVWRRGGWDAVDEMYARPPSSTAQVLFPALYRADAEPERPPVPSDPGRRWKRALTASFGAFDVMLLLENADVTLAGSARLGDHVGAVRGWRGGILRAWTRGPRTAVHAGLVDAGVATPSGPRRRLCRALRGWVAESFPEAAPARSRSRRTQTWTVSGRAVGLACRGSSVEIAVAPSARRVRRLFR